MEAVSPAALLTAWARLLLGALGRAGVRDVVLSPGSRNTPFTWAALREPELRCRTILDERSAAFFAVGHARRTGRPALLVCTSGSAAANYFPAVVEAAESGTPLLVLTADRPLELQHAAAPQTIDQVGMYGGFARAFFDLGTPDAHPAMMAALPRIAAQAVLTARSPAPGPVHLNARARKPLEPVDGSGTAATELRALVDRLLDAVPAGHAPVLGPDPEAIEALAADCRAARRPLLVFGPEASWRAVPHGVAAELVRAGGFALAAETASQLRLGWPPADLEEAAPLDAFEALLGVPSFREGHAPDLIVHVGRPPTDSAWSAAMAAWTGVRRWVIASRGWPDPWSSARAVVHADPAAALAGLGRALRSDPGDEGSARERRAWRDALRQANAAARAVIDDALRDEFSEAAAVRTAADALPDGGTLALGNSLPIREADLALAASRRVLRVWSQRGANGIDGLVSGAAGAAAAGGEPTTLLLGDVSFAHDIGGLAAARDLEGPFAIVVLDNGGGRIFEQLPLAARLTGDPVFDAWLTPPRLDLAAAAAAYGVPFVEAADSGALRRALAQAGERAGATLIRVVVPSPGPVAHRRELVRRIEARLAP